MRDGTYGGDGNRDLVLDKDIMVLSINGPAVTIIDCEGSSQTPHRGFLVTDGRPRIVGFTITNGYAPLVEDVLIVIPGMENGTCDTSTMDQKSGGGIFCQNSDPIITDCIISDCHATHTGGGIFAANGSPRITNCTLTDNTTTSDIGAGINLVSCRQRITKIDNCTISGQFGSAINCELSAPSITNSVIGPYENGLVLKCSSPLVSGCTISQHDVDGIHNDGFFRALDLAGDVPEIDISDCLIEDNGAAGITSEMVCPSGLIDACVFEFSDTIAITESTIRDNGLSAVDWHSLYTIAHIQNCAITGNGPTVTCPGGAQGAIAGGSISEITNCLIAENCYDLCTKGAGVYASGPPGLVLSITNSTIRGNVGPGKSGGVLLNGTSATIENSILWDNVADEVTCPDGGGCGTGVKQAYLDDLGVTHNLTVAHSDVQGGECGVCVESPSTLTWDSGSNIDADPVFCCAGADNFRLCSGSPCIDAGDSDAVPDDVFDLDDDGNVTEPIPIDLDGNPRFAGVDLTVDMGAYESQGPATQCCPEDLNGDGVVDGTDLAMLLSAQSSGCPVCPDCPADFDGDGDVDSADLAELISAWGPCP